MQTSRSPEKKILTWLLISAWTTMLAAAPPTNLFFLHHSTGQGLITEGGMRAVINSYNSTHGTAFTFWDHGYSWEGLFGPDGLQVEGVFYMVPGDNTNPDGLHYLWTSDEAECLTVRNQILQNHQVIAFKSCFPASDIPDAATLNQYKHDYLGMRDVFEQHPEHLFIVMSTPPLRQIATTPTAANNARLFAEWISGEYVAGRDNLVCFNLFDYLAGANNMLKDAYEPDNADPGDSHPNALANQTVGPLLAEFFITAALNFDGGGSPGLMPPGSVSASDGTYVDRVAITWSMVPDATHYEIWRHTENNPAGASALATNLADTSYSDLDVILDAIYWYWVRAANTGHTSTFSIANSGFASAAPPAERFGPVIRCNAMTNEVTVFLPETATITVTLDPGANSGIGADWWVIAAPQTGDWYYLDANRQWINFPPGHLYQCTPVHWGPLFNLPETTLADAMTLEPDVYSLYFAVDLMDGVLNYPDGPILFDRVDVTVE